LLRGVFLAVSVFCWTAKAYLKPIQTVINGVPFGRPYQSPFAVK
jgi:hypothetical protein